MKDLIERLEKATGHTPWRAPLSKTAQDARKPPAPALLLGADQERPEIPAKARVARAASERDLTQEASDG